LLSGFEQKRNGDAGHEYDDFMSISQQIIDQFVGELGREFGAFFDRGDAEGLAAVFFDEARELTAHARFEQGDDGARRHGRFGSAKVASSG
jgi:hypothetical protein